MRVAILGTRGLPARYGGFETFAEELSTRLAARGHIVTVYGRRRFFEEVPDVPDYRGVRLRSVPTVFHKYLETPIQGLVSFLDASASAFDAVILCNAANSPFAWILNFKKLPYAVNVDGVERKRAKWNSLGKLWYCLGEFCAVKLSHRLIADARVIADYYEQSYGAESVVIPYGATAHLRQPGPTLARYGLSPRNYVLYVSRLEPENNALGVVRAYKESRLAMPLLMVGDAPYAREYIEQVKAEAAGCNVVFAGYQFGESYQELQSNCWIYVQATEVGGTHPALVEAMAYGNCIIANGTMENLEVLGEAGIFYEKNDFSSLARKMKDLASKPDTVSAYRESAQKRALLLYDWERVTDLYEELLAGMI